MNVLNCKAVLGNTNQKDLHDKKIHSDSQLTSWCGIAKKQKDEYEFKNIIEEKKVNGVYSQWRCNKVGKTCLCGFIGTCLCNVNPAIQDIQTTEVLGTLLLDIDSYIMI